MPSYNLVSEPWIPVKMLSGESRKIGLKELVQNASSIAKLEPPVFRGEFCWIYEFCLIQFLAVIVMAAHFKPKNHFAARSYEVFDDLIETGGPDETVVLYLEEYFDRFDIFSERFPFLQNNQLASLLQPTVQDDGGKKKTRVNPDGFVSLLNPFAPGMNNKLFGRVRSIGTQGNVIRAFRFTPEEFAYILLYISSMGPSPMPTQYPNKALCAPESIHITRAGKNLHETILLNCVSLRGNTKGEHFDRPVWELDSVSDAAMYTEKMADNVLMNTYFPCFPILAGRKLDEDGCLERVVIARTQDFVPVGKRELDSLRELYVTQNPWGIPEIDKTKTKKAKRDVYRYWNYSVASRVWSMCTAATGEVKYNAPSVVREGPQCQHLVLYSRTFTDKHKTAMSACGKTELRQDIRCLLEDGNHKLASEYCLFAEFAVKRFKSAVYGVEAGNPDEQVNELASAIEDHFICRFVGSLRTAKAGGLDAVHPGCDAVPGGWDDVKMMEEMKKEITAIAVQVFRKKNEACSSDFISYFEHEAYLGNLLGKAARIPHFQGVFTDSCADTDQAGEDGIA